MDREQHIVQDAAEHYATYVLQRRAEEIGLAMRTTSAELLTRFRDYLGTVGLDEDAFANGPHPEYKTNADLQLPLFVDRLGAAWPPASITFENVEAEYRNLGRKGDLLIRFADGRASSVSLKNYVGASGIRRPQVGSGTFLSFAAGFVFERVGVGVYSDPRVTDGRFRGADRATRNAVLEFERREALIGPLNALQDIHDGVREVLLGPDYAFHTPNVKAIAREAADRGIDVMLDLFDLLGEVRVRTIFLERAGLDGTEEALFFDAERYLDSITNTRYHDLRHSLNDPATAFRLFRHKQNIRFEFERDGRVLLHADVPLTINANGAWYRPKQRYTGERIYDDKGVPTSLQWGQRRPRKSAELATSTNLYVNLAKLGLFG